MKSTKKQSLLKRMLSGVLSLACVFSGTAMAGAALIKNSAIEVNAASSETEVPFSWDNASVYFLLTDRFCNGDTSNDHSYGRGLNQNGQAISYDTLAAFQGGDFAGITKKLNEGYFNDLGVNAIWLSAPYEQIHGYCVGGNGDSFAHYSYHGYYVLDYTESDKNFGTKEEFKTMVDTAHEHGIRIVMDVVMNHAGYQTLKDMSEYDFGPLKSGWESYYYAHQNINNGDYHGFIGYDDNTAGDWAKWWGSDWIRCGLPGYTKGSGEIEGSLADLPDFKTGVNSSVGLPQILKTKWSKEGTLSAKQAKYGNDTVSGYISTWLAEWVSEFGVDGFRCDTAKHVELSAWKKLKDKCVVALKQWRQNNPSAPGADWTDDFWMTGECFGLGVDPSSQYYSQGGFDSMINFSFTAVGSCNIPSAGSVEGVYSDYANRINNNPSFNVLTYLASHDTTLISGDRNYAGSFLLMCPGGIQIYYGDEINRPYDTNPKAMKDLGAGHQTRKFMNWDSMDQSVLAHWQKVGQFRNNHLAVGAGQHKVISSYSSGSGYTFSRTYTNGDIDDKIVATLFAPANTSLTIDVSSVWSDGIEITNFYDGTTCKVSGGKVTFNTGANGTILMQEPQGKKGKVIVTHIDKDKNTVLKTETMAGLIGDSYTVNSLSLEGYKVASTSGSMTGTYAETDKNVTIYYTFDSANYGFVTVKYVDAASGDELADAETTTGRVGAAYSVSPKDIKNYECNESLTTNATGTYKAGTTTVTFKYSYVEPTNLRVHYYNKNNWGSVYMYAYDETNFTPVKEYNGKWPGTQMTAEGDGWFVCEADGEWAQVIFNNNAGTQEPSGGTNAKGYECSGEVYIKDGKLATTGKVKVKYITTDGTVLGSATLTGVADGTTTYTTQAKTFTGYTLQSTPTNATGVYTEETITVVYTYKSNTASSITNNTTVSSTSVIEGNKITFTGSASGGTAPYTYSYQYQKSGKTNWVDFGTGATMVFKPGIGTYTVKVTAKDSAGKSAVKSFTITCTGGATGQALANNSTVSATKIASGGKVTIYGKASGGTSPYTYTYQYQKSGKTTWTSFGSGTAAVFKPGDGLFTIKVTVKDSAGKSIAKSFTITCGTSTGGTLTNNSTASATTIASGGKVTFTGKATGGTAPYTYKYSYLKAGKTTWVDFATGASAALKPADSTYTVKVTVTDAAGKTATKSFTITCGGGSTTGGALTNSSSVSATTTSSSNKITITGKATGGTSPYYYSYYYLKSGKTSYNVIGSEMTTATSVAFKPGVAATYTIMVKVTDNTGESVSKTFTVKFT